MSRKKTLSASLLCGAAAIALMGGAGTANAQEAQFDIAPQPLSTALNAFSIQSRHPIIFKSDLADAKFTQGVAGSADVQVALNEVLAGTGLTWRRDGETFIIVKAAADPQSGSAAGDGAEVEALIVTAQKREEDIQDVPIAISAFTQEALERSQIAGGPDLITQVPNMTFTKTNFTSYTIQLRGIGTQAISATTDPAVAVAFNNTPFVRNRFFEQEFYDLQRVEVLRGPQGTLYGRNATAGVVNIISQKPKFLAEAKASADIANYNSTRVEGMVNIPLVEDIAALRLAGAWTKRDGYATNEITGNPIDGRDLWSTRLSLRFAPTDAIDVNLIWEHFEEDDDRLRSGKQLCKKDVITEVGGVPVQSFDQRLATTNISAPWVAVQPRLSQGCIRESLYSPESFQTPNGAMVPYYIPLSGVGFDPAFFDPYASQVQSHDLRVIESTIDPEYRASSDLGEMQISWGVTDNLTLDSETAYARDYVYSLQDFNRFNTVEGAFCTTQTGGGQNCEQAKRNGNGPTDAIARGVLRADGYFCDPQLGCSNRLVAVDVSTAKSTHFSQEFRLGSDFEGPFNFSLGANFLRYDTTDKYYVFINSLSYVSAKDEATIATPYVGGVTNNTHCDYRRGLVGDPNEAYGYHCVYIEQNSISNIQDQGHNYFLSTNPYKLISYAVFGEAYYNITDALKVTAGLRWTVDKKEAPRVPSWVLVGHSRGHPVMEVVDQEWREPTGRLAIDWKPDLSFTDETLLYASYAHGYKAGGANPPPFVNPLSPQSFGAAPDEEFVQFASVTRPKTFDPEFIDAFELGAKNTLLDGSVTLNLAAFYYDYKDYQISEIVDRSAFNRNFDATVWGIEIEADWRPLENLKLGFKGGYENTRIADGEQAVDLMDRTAGMEGWSVVRPFPTSPSSCILPTALFSHTGPLPQAPGEDPIILTGAGGLFDVGGGGGSADGGCERAYLLGVDPITNNDYVANPSSAPGWPSGTYPGWNPEWAPNNGEGFFKDLGGNPLPNAPEFTATVTADYTVPLPNEWLATFHTDLYWQSESNWRIFDDHEYNKLDEYFTMNVAAIFTNEEAGWKVMAYVKNVFDRDSITGAFLNSDDTALTTNVFLTEPRLYGLRVTKDWRGGPLLGSFGARRDGPYPFEIELGGQVQRHEANNALLAPSSSDLFSGTINPLPDQQDDLDWGDGRDVKLTWRPNDRWKLALGARFGKTNGSMPWSSRSEVGDTVCSFYPDQCELYDGYFLDIRYNYSISSTTDREEHAIIDFTVGMDTGLGLFESATLGGGLRHASLESGTSAHIIGMPNWDISVDNDKYPNPPGVATVDRFDTRLTAEREFKGIGPVLTWDAFQRLVGNKDVGVLGLDWSVTGGVLFGEREVSITGSEVQEHFDMPSNQINFIGHWFPDTVTTTPVNIHRSEDVTVPNFGASLGLTYEVDRFRIGAGYRWERYQDAIDGGFDEAQEEDRTIDGPYLKISVGFGG